MNPGDLRKRSGEELQGELIALRQEEFNLRIQKGIGQMARSSQIKSVRRNIARLKTVMNEREKT